MDRVERGLLFVEREELENRNRELLQELVGYRGQLEESVYAIEDIQYSIGSWKGRGISKVYNIYIPSRLPPDLSEVRAICVELQANNARIEAIGETLNLQSKGD